MLDYSDDGQPIGVTFALSVNEQQMAFRLPANIEGVRKVFQRQKLPGRDNDRQIINTAWRNIRDWVLAQMALVEAGNAQVEEVFLPYLTNGKGQTMYEAFKEGQLFLPEGGAGI